MRELLSKALRIHYSHGMQVGKRKLGKNPAVKLNFKSLHIASESPTLFLNPNDEGLSVELSAWGFREPMNSYVLSQFIKREKSNIDVVVDVGSNIGYFPLIELLSGAPHVIAIEPVPESHSLLKRNLANFNNVTFLNTAVSDKKETIKMYVPTGLNWATALKESALHVTRISDAFIKEIIEVPALSLQDVVNNQNLAEKNVLVRMDVEGFERKILSNIPKEVYALSFELHSNILGYDNSVLLLQKIRGAGFQIEKMLWKANSLCPLVKLFGLKNGLALFEKIGGEKRVLNFPDFNEIEKWLQTEECFHIFAVRMPELA